MRLSVFGRFALIGAALLASACDSRVLTGADATGRVSVKIPFPRAVSGIASQTQGNGSEVASLHIVISIVSSGQVVLDRRVNSGDPALQESTDNSNGVEATLTVDFHFPASAERETFVFEISAFDADNVEIFRMGPTTFQLATDGRTATAETELQYVGPGKDVTSVLISPRSITVVAGETQPVSCVGNPGSQTVFPYSFDSDNEGIAIVEGNAQVRGVAIGTTRIVCRLEFGTKAEDAINVTVTSAGTPGLTIVSGGNQSGPVSTVLVQPIKVLVRGASGIVARDVNVQFQVSTGGGQISPATQLTSSDGTAQATWTLGSAVGTQSILVTVPSLGFSLTVNATGTSVGTTGSITGTVRNTGGTPQSGILLELRNGSATTGSTVATQTTGASGTYTFSNLPAGPYTISASGAGFLTNATNPAVTAGQTTTQNISMSASSSTGAITGVVRDAAVTSGSNGLSGVTVELRSGAGNTTGTILASTTTNAQGAFAFTSLAAGAYTVRATRASYADASANVTVGTQSVNADVIMSALLTAGQVRIVLTWTNAQLDLDSRLMEPGGQLIYYGANNSENGCIITNNPFACLQHDALSFDSQGQLETILIGQVKSGTYFFHVYNFTSGTLNGTPNDNLLSNSGATVDVFFGSSQTASFHFTVPAGNGDEWQVFQLAGSTSGSLTPVNTLISVVHNFGSVLGESGASAAKKGKQ